MTMIALLFSAMALASPSAAPACYNPQLGPAEELSRDGGEVFRQVILHIDQSPVDQEKETRAKIAAAAATDQPNWQLIDRLIAKERSLRNVSLRSYYDVQRRLLDKLSLRDRAIYLRIFYSESDQIYQPSGGLKENYERQKAVRLAIVASANCLILSKTKLDALLSEHLRLELQRQMLVNSLSDALHAREDKATRLGYLRRDYPLKSPPPPTIIVPDDQSSNISGQKPQQPTH